MQEHKEFRGVPLEDEGRAIRSKSSPETGSGLSASIPHALSHKPGDRVLVHFQGWFGRKARPAIVLSETRKRFRIKYDDMNTTHYVPKYAVTPHENAEG